MVRLEDAFRGFKMTLIGYLIVDQITGKPASDIVYLDKDEAIKKSPPISRLKEVRIKGVETQLG